MVAMANNSQEWLDAAQTVDQETVEVSGPEYPFIQWVNGKPSLKQAGGVVYTGGWFLPASQASEPPDGWTPGALVHDNGQETPGYFRRDITVAVIRMRRRWLVYENATSSSYPWDDYKTASTVAARGGGKATGHTQALCIVKGLEHLGPVVLTMKGTVSAAFTGSRGKDGVLSRFNNLVIREANNINARRGVPNKFPYRAFWLAVGPKRDDKGNPVFDEVGTRPNSSMVTLPTALGLADKLPAGELAKMFVGKEALAEFTQHYTAAETWANAWNQAMSAEPAEAGGNGYMPEEPPLPEDEMPF